MAWSCEKCQEVTTAGEVLKTVVSIALLGGIAFAVFTYKDTIKEAVRAAIPKNISVSGVPKRKSRKRLKVAA